MKIFTIILLILMNSYLTKSQVTDSQIAKSLLGNYHYKVNSILDSLKIWYHVHIVESASKEVRWASIADGKGVVKVFRLLLDKNQNYIIKEVVINYRHDSREQVEGAKKVADANRVHVGTYSTDIFFELKN